MVNPTQSISFSIHETLVKIGGVYIPNFESEKWYVGKIIKKKDYKKINCFIL